MLTTERFEELQGHKYLRIEQFLKYKKRTADRLARRPLWLEFALGVVIGTAFGIWISGYMQYSRMLLPATWPELIGSEQW